MSYICTYKGVCVCAPAGASSLANNDRVTDGHVVGRRPAGTTDVPPTWYVQTASSLYSTPPRPARCTKKQTIVVCLNKGSLLTSVSRICGGSAPECFSKFGNIKRLKIQVAVMSQFIKKCLVSDSYPLAKVV